MIVDNKYNDDFYLMENFYQFVLVNNQDIFDINKKIK